MFSLRERKGVHFVRCDGLGKGVKHGFSTRRGGVSEGVYESLNLGFFSDDDEKAVKTNWKLFLSALDLQETPLVYQHQVHATKLRKAEVVGSFSLLGEGDALWTDEPGVALAIVTADCVPVFIVSKGEKPFVAAIHAGWRGLASGIISNTVAEVSSKIPLEIGELHVAAGPHIGPCCYEVGVDTAQKLRKRVGKSVEVVKSSAGGKGYANLGLLVQQECLSLGIPESQILISDMCTCCHDDSFYSYRRSGAKERGRMGNVIALAANGY